MSKETNRIRGGEICEKGTKPTKKESAQSDLPVERKIKKTTRKYHFLGKWYDSDVLFSTAIKGFLYISFTLSNL